MSILRAELNDIKYLIWLLWPYRDLAGVNEEIRDLSFRRDSLRASLKTLEGEQPDEQTTKASVA